MKRALIDGCLRVGNWVSQGFSSIDREEIIAKSVFEVIVFSLSYTIITRLLEKPASVMIAFLISHSANYIFATNVHGPRIVDDPTKGRLPEKAVPFLKKLKDFCDSTEYITSSAVFGSISTGKFHSQSDIDVKLCRKKGLINAIWSYLFLFRIRFYSNVRFIPADIYVIPAPDSYSPKEEEVPIIITDDNGMMAKRFDESITLEEFLSDYRDSYS